MVVPKFYGAPFSAPINGLVIKDAVNFDPSTLVDKLDGRDTLRIEFSGSDNLETTVIARWEDAVRELDMHSFGVAVYGSEPSHALSLSIMDIIHSFKRIRCLYVDSLKFDGDTELRFLSDMKHLEALWVNWMSVTDISILGEFTNLNWLYLNQNDYTINTSCLGRLTNLRRLRISLTPVDDLIPLSKLTGLEFLALDSNGSDNDMMDALTPMTDLRVLSLGYKFLSYTQILQLIEALPVLETLVIYDGEINEMDPFPITRVSTPSSSSKPAVTIVHDEEESHFLFVKE